MRSGSAFQKRIWNRPFFPWAAALVLLILNLFQAGSGNNDRDNLLFLRLQPFHVTDILCSSDLSFIDSQYCNAGHLALKHFIKQHSTQPLSRRNVNKTRPRGIPAKIMDIKNVYLPDHQFFFLEYSQLFHVVINKRLFSSRFKESNLIRPPPFHAVTIS